MNTNTCIQRVRNLAWLQGKCDFVEFCKHFAFCNIPEVATIVSRRTLRERAGHLCKVLPFFKALQQHISRFQGFLLGPGHILLLSGVVGFLAVFVFQQDLGHLDWHFEVKDFYFELEGRVRWYHRWVTILTVGVVWRTDQCCLLPLLQLRHAFVPPLNDCADS